MSSNYIDNVYVGHKTITNAIIDSFGTNCSSIPRKSIAMGSGSKVGADSNCSYAIGFNAAVSDSLTAAGSLKNEFSFAIGTNVSAFNRTTMVIGRQAKSNAKNQFVWGGLTAGTFTPTGGEGTFNISPNGGLSGFFIENKNFISCVIDVIKDNPDIIKAALNIT